MGLSCYDPATKRFRNFCSGQGLHEDEVGNLFENRDHRGTDGGLCMEAWMFFNPAEVPTGKQAARNSDHRAEGL